MQADAEHQQHNADFGELARKTNVGHEPRRGGTEDNSSDQIADQSGQLETHGNQSRDQGQPQRGSNRGDQSYAVGHRLAPMNRMLLIGSIREFANRAGKTIASD